MNFFDWHTLGAGYQKHFNIIAYFKYFSEFKTPGQATQWPYR